MTFDELHRVIKRGDHQRLETELDGGTDVHLRNSTGWTLLMLAASEGNTAIGKLLIERGSEINARTTPPQSGGMQYSALTLAVMNGKPSFVTLLLQHSARRESPFASTFATFLDWCDLYSASTQEQMRNIRRTLAEGTEGQHTDAQPGAPSSPASR